MEELKEALRAYRQAVIIAEHCYGEGAESEALSAEAGAEAAVESLFGRIKEERDRLIEERRLDAGWMYAHELEGENASLRAELGRIREELKEANATIEKLRRLENYVCGVIAMGSQADLTVEMLPR